MRLLWQQIANSTVTEILCNSSFDGVVLDAEHGNWNNETLVDCIRVIRLYNKFSFVRMKYNDQLIQLCYDNSCIGIILSNTISSPKRNVGYGLVQNNTWGKQPVVKKGLVIIAQIESKEGINNLPNMVNDGVCDCFMLGHYDLSASCGEPGNFASGSFLNKIKIFEDAVPSHKRGVHLVKNITQSERYKDYGIVAYSLDTLSIIDGIDRLSKYA